MKVLVKSAKVICPESKFHLKKVDMLIEKGKIVSVGKKISDPADKVITSKNLHVSVGWMDMQVNYCDPGMEQRETIETGIRASLAGGFTAVGVWADTNPPMDNKTTLRYVQNQVGKLPIDLYPIANVSEKGAGKEMAELFDLSQCGAVGFSDNKQSIQNPDLMKRVLLYVQSFDGLILQFPMDENLSHGGIVHESQETTSLGLKMSPDIAEELMVSRDITLVEYTDGRIHFGPISVAGSVKKISEARRNNLPVTASVAIANLVYQDKDLAGYDTNLKVMPPLRSDSDRKALIKGIKKGTIQVIVSDHTPQEVETKHCEFDHASFGMIGTQNVLHHYATYLSKELSLEEFIPCLTSGPRGVMGLENPEISEDAAANLTFFDPDVEHQFDAEMNQSLSSNSPLLNKQVKGTVIGVYNNGKLFQI